MPLPLTDSRWTDLEGSYGGTADVVQWLSEGYEKGLSDGRLGDLINEVQHQGGTSTAMYAVAPHLVQLAQVGQNRPISLLIQAGLIYADSTSEHAIACPPFLWEEFQATAPQGAAALAPMLYQTTSCEEYIWATAALAGFKGYHSLGRLLSAIDFYQGHFYHPTLGPFPK